MLVVPFCLYVSANVRNLVVSSRYVFALVYKLKSSDLVCRTFPPVQPITPCGNVLLLLYTHIVVKA